MPLRYQPQEGSVLICDFRGYEVPEMIEVRPVVVIRKHRTNSLLVTVVPLSTTAPDCVPGIVRESVFISFHNLQQMSFLPSKPQYAALSAFDGPKRGVTGRIASRCRSFNLKQYC
jgi:uncharacterized protein YifN (PemK superfamily)